MGRVIIIVNAEVEESERMLRRSPVTEKMVIALKEAILDNSVTPPSIEVVSAGSLWSKSIKLKLDDPHNVYCPLTIQLPQWLTFPGQNIYQSCKDIEGVRARVERNFGYKTSVNEVKSGDLWLPIILTAKGPIYGEVIEEGHFPNSYLQPVDLTDEIRQPLYQLAYQLINHLQATPSVYLLQFRLSEKELIFDRLWPFPAAPALASLKVQKPNLFTCYWYCLINKPLLDVTILPNKAGVVS